MILLALIFAIMVFFFKYGNMSLIFLNKLIIIVALSMKVDSIDNELT